ncbi:glycosyl hydrolase [Massariosphaeria phaeospora]|uniref:Arabinan endo-1,5-alpha-L-arabinosidase n=1 Tax=Massariosphaeria phaeospora TaxID=100035 RepID=A0A7C8MDS7_9PLEO|nr:glycosyl hydrolase [Massariosphaeria phaeospora]KAF2870831.1 glycosyl hydrolase [Massariosphaeria phaeospora]
MFHTILFTVLGYLITTITTAPVSSGPKFPNPENCTGNCSGVHDPSVIKKDGVYYRFSTSGNIAIATAPSLTGPWDYKGPLLEHGTSIDLFPDQDIWAPSVNKIDNTYYVYYSVSKMWSAKSQLGVATSPSLDPGTWHDHGSMRFPSYSGYNLIDPNLLMDGTEAYFTFGSWRDDIIQTQLTGDFTLFSDWPMYNIINNSTVGANVTEGAFQFKWEDHYYVFFSQGECCRLEHNPPNPGDEYKIMVCRADHIWGEYRDADGKSCRTESGGTLVLAGHDDVVYPGGQGVMIDEGSLNPVMYYHYVDPRIGYEAEKFQFGFNYLDFSSGWPVVV